LQTPATLKLVTVEKSSLFTEKMRGILFDFCRLQVLKNATSIPDAVDLIRRHQPDAVILNVRPGAAADQNGFDLLRLLRKVFPAIMVMALINHIEASYQVLSEDLGVDYFLDKSRDFHKIPETLFERFDLKGTASF
jgi:DNA-binding NarL/FixJ family response regulator